MKEQMKRTVYEAPLTELFQIELEGAFMAGSVVEDNGASSVEALGHESLPEFDMNNSGDSDDFYVTWE